MTLVFILSGAANYGGRIEVGVSPQSVQKLPPLPVLASVRAQDYDSDSAESLQEVASFKKPRKQPLPNRKTASPDSEKGRPPQQRAQSMSRLPGALAGLPTTDLSISPRSNRQATDSSARSSQRPDNVPSLDLSSLNEDSEGVAGKGRLKVKPKKMVSQI